MKNQSKERSVKNTFSRGFCGFRCPRQRFCYAKPAPIPQERMFSFHENYMKYMIEINLDVMMAKRKISLGALAERVNITPANLSILKTGKAKAIRFSTLEAICRELDCQPGDIIEYRAEEELDK